MEKVAKICPSCGRLERHEYDSLSLERWRCGANVQDVFPDRNPFEREFLITGMCFDCQSKTFHAPKPGEDWGEILGECDCCGAPIYTRDNGICAVCGSTEFS